MVNKDETLLYDVKCLHGLNCNVLERVGAGVLNDIRKFRCDGDTYYLKGYIEKNKEEVENVLAVERFARDSGIPAVTAVSEKIIEHERKSYVLYPEAKGLICERNNLSFGQLKELGSILARIHMVDPTPLDGIAPTFQRDWDTNQFALDVSKITAIIDDKAHQTDFDKSVKEYLNWKLQKTKQLKYSHNELTLGPSGLVHGDFQEQNIFFDGEHVTGIIDWEKSGVTTLSTEVVRAILYLCFEKRYSDPESYKRAAVFLYGYRSYRDIDKQVLISGVSAHYAKQLHSTWIEKQYYYHGNTELKRFFQQKKEENKFLSQIEHQEFIQKIEDA